MIKTYLDNAATTPLDKRVIKEMKRYWRKDFANPSSIHSMGVEAKKTLQKARKTIADLLHAHDREMTFTSGGTEANNLAVFGLVNKGAHFITTEIEHSSILECFKELERKGFKTSYMKVDGEGLVNPKDLRELIKPETVLVSIGYANGEIGTIQPMKEVMKEVRHARKERSGPLYFHTDASAAVQYLNLNVEELGIDLMTLDAQKIYGPKGIGALYVRDGVKIAPIIFGGGQEKGLRSGTENIPLIVGFAKAMEINERLKERENDRLTKIRDHFFSEVKKLIPNSVINGSLESRLPNNIDISIKGEDGEMLVLRLDEAGIVCSSGSACASGSGESAIVRTISQRSGMDEDGRAKGALRFSLGRDTKERHIKHLLKALSKICK